MRISADKEGREGAETYLIWLSRAIPNEGKNPAAVALGRLAHRVQITSDGLKACLEAVEGAVGTNVDYAELAKLYGATGGDSPEKKSRVEIQPDRFPRL